MLSWDRSVSWELLGQPVHSHQRSGEQVTEVARPAVQGGALRVGERDPRRRRGGQAWGEQLPAHVGRLVDQPTGETRTCRCASATGNSSARTSKIAMSAGAPTASVPAARPSARAGCVVTAATTSASGTPTASSLAIVVGRSKTGPCSDRACRSVEIVWGRKPAASCASSTSKANPPEPCPRSNSTPRPAAACTAGPVGTAMPLAQCVMMSPGRSRSSTSSSCGGAVPMWTMTGTPQAAAAARPRRSGSTPLSPTVSRSMRTLTPWISSRLAWIVSIASGTSQLSRSRLSPVRPARPIAEMFSRAGTRTAAAAATRRRPSSVYAPADPASTHVVTPECQATGSGSMPQ